MAMYYQGSSETQADGLQTLYLLNPNYVGGYSDTHYMNSAAAHAPNSATVPHAPPAQQFVGIPLSHDPSRPSPALPQQEDIQAVHNTIPRFHYNNNNIWSLFDQSGNGNQPNMPQGLSLSLSQHQTGFDDKSLPCDHDFRAGLGLISPKISSSPPFNGANSMQSVIMGSKYLEATQQLLDEVANVGKGPKIDRPEPSKDKAKIIEKLNGEASSGNNGRGAELTTPQRQEIQMKKAKLISMLDEVDQRYKQYNHQMQIIVASFEQAAGIGSAKSYTQLALNTILKQFRCLKSAISAQIKALTKTLGEDDQSLVEGSRLKFVDHHLRQQKAMQQMGMMQNNAWRPQRGLPERAVSVLRAWLFEHFLHPYPKDSDKVMLAKQTGLTRSQVSNWFINARVRLWKPMVEEMYLEETKNQEQISPETTSKTGPRQKESNSKKNNITPPVIDHLQSKQDNLILNLDPSPTEISPSKITNSPTGSSLQGRSGFAQFITSLNMENLSEKNPKKPRNDHNSPSSILSMEMETKGAGNTSKGWQTRENYLSMAAANTCTQGPGFGTYGIREFSRFNGDQQISPGNFPGNNNFSLTLALPPSETSQRTHHQQNFFSHRNFEFETRIEKESNGINNGIESDSHPNIGYEMLDFQNRKQFPAQLLPDFVA